MSWAPRCALRGNFPFAYRQRDKTANRFRKPARWAPSASAGKKPGGSGDSDKKGAVDWDGAWQQIKREIQGTGSSNPSDWVDRPAQFTSRTDSGRNAKDDIKADESRVLNTWSSETFTKLGILSVITLLFFFIIVIGPPPDDGRCSLPWC
jgi:hypothetical protein